MIRSRRNNHIVNNLSADEFLDEENEFVKSYIFSNVLIFLLSIVIV